MTRSISTCPREGTDPLKASLSTSTYVVEWLASSPEDAILSFLTIERALGITGDRLRSLRHSHKGLSVALAALGLVEVIRASTNRAAGYRRIN